ncbi:hypothetical protein PIB30_111790, partial [Stylosanthes scabra]|nr:hypothetical protein [Stylosanthes scabra]
RKSGPTLLRHPRRIFTSSVRIWPRMPRRLLLPLRVLSRPNWQSFFPTSIRIRSVSSRTSWTG